MRRLFGTDGVRGLANGEVLTPELALSLAASAARVLAERDRSHRPLAVVGRDPRASGEMLEAAVVAGLASAGADAMRVGVLPTPAVAHLVDALSADLGVMISASHNAMPDNGIKLFAAGGHKLPDAVELAVEEGLGTPFTRPTGARIGRVRDLPDAEPRYVAHLLASTPQPLSGLRVVVDCAYGAASTVAPDCYARAGAEVVALHADPDGLNINDGVGSTHLGPLRAAVRAHGADLGIAHDGDADRCLAVDADGRDVDGDQIMAVLALAMHEAGELVDDTLVATVMSNLGLHLAMREHGISVADHAGRRPVRAGGAARGRVRARRRAVGPRRAARVRHHRRRAADGPAPDGPHGPDRQEPRRARRRRHRSAAGAGERPGGRQGRRRRVAHRPQAVAAAEVRLGDTGRVLLRPSGTEQLVRVMVEAPTIEEARGIATELSAVVAAS